ncbi:uncharacterized protein LOC128734063 [Sabethes cyaneus]|uniref:uncharacterized protein LOC128734063 n=1 Tax=Sabethes cyaneus TaxID=53552 RepID=UPI00237D3A33|nr:uncharacterized protein LOC128734063 [Sabethes cyaneus]
MCKVTREAAWQEIAAEFEGKFDTDQLTAKWYNLRIQFKAYWAKQKREQGMSHITWKYFKPLTFIGGSRKDQQRLLAECEVNTTSPKKSTPFQSKSSIKRLRPSYHNSLHSKRAPVSQNTTLMSPANDFKNVSPILASLQQSLQNIQKVDSFQVFGNFLAEELRKIPDRTLANQMQRKLTRFLMDCMDEVDTAYGNQSLNNKTDL